MANLVPVMYVGRHQAVEVDPDGLGEITVVKGETITVEVSVASGLLAQPNNWRVNQPRPEPKPEVLKEKAGSK